MSGHDEIGARRATSDGRTTRAAGASIRIAPLVAFAGAALIGGTPSGLAAHGGGISAVSLTACEEKSRSDDCEYVDHHDDLYRGTCQLIVGDMQCVRNQPIIKGDLQPHRSDPLNRDR